MNIKSKFEDYIINRKDKIKITDKNIKRGDVFLALKGKNFHGNKFINSSIRKGAKYCLTDNKNYKENKKIIYVKNIFDYLTELAKKKRKLYQGQVVGITGSAGKTTLKETLAFFLKKEHIISYSQKSFNNELGVLISLLNLNLNSSFSIFEIGTNNFGEIKDLTNLVKPTQIFITNIQSTHLKNFKTKNNIAKEKSDIFNSKYNSKRKKLYLNINTNSENIILKRAKKEKKIKLIFINNLSNNYFIKKIGFDKKNYSATLSINKKDIILNTALQLSFRLNNLLFCYAFFVENDLKVNIITKNYKSLKPVDGRGLIHNISLGTKKVKIIDESYNANPETMFQSIDYLENMKKLYSKKIIILGNMNELGSKSDELHLGLLNYIDNYSFKFVILCGKFYKRSIKKLNNPRNKFIYFESKNEIMIFLKKFVHNNDIILIKCSNVTEINKFTKKLLKKGIEV